MKCTKIMSLAVLMIMTSFSIARSMEESIHMPARAASAEFERIKALKGIWEWTSLSDGKTEKARVEYLLTSGGSAVVEKLFTGTPHEMTSVYYDRDGKLEMTHYCMLGNRPHLKLKSADARTMDFVLDAKASGIKPKKEQHMHSLKLDFKDSDHFTQNWICFEKGKPHESVVISLTRIK